MPPTPYISVIMSVYNAEKYVGESIRSILDQTFSDFEFIIINDASTDRSPEIIRSFKDKRIRLLNNQERSYPTRNKGLRVAKGKYICIMDADDISLPQRFERQTLFMDANPDVGLAGSGYRVVGKEKDFFRESDYEKIKVHLMRNNCFIHPSVIIRHDLLKKHNLRYIRKYYYSSDYDFIARAARYFPITNIPEVLMHYRIHEEQVTMQYRGKQVEYADDISLEQVRYIGVNPDKHETKLHIAFLKGIQIGYSKKHDINNWLEKIRTANRKTGYYKESELEAFFASLLSLQPFCRETLKTHLVINSKRQKRKADLTDVTFVMPLRIDSTQLIENIDTVVRYLTKHFDTNIHILEADSNQRYYPCNEKKTLIYEFIEDYNELFHRTKWINRLLRSAQTPYVAVWEAGVIAKPEQIIEAVNKLRKGEVVMSFPYDGRFYSCDRISSSLFISDINIKILINRTPVMQLINGYHSVGGAFIVNKEKYLKAGGENENIIGLYINDTERVKRMEIFNLTVSRLNGPLFFLLHPNRKNSGISNAEIQRINQNELQLICKAGSI